MIKKIILISATIILITYVCIVIFVLHGFSGNETCTHVDIVIKDNMERNFVTEQMIVKMLQKAGINPVGEKMKNINTDSIELFISGNELIKRVECYKTTSGALKIEIYQKIPVLRVISISDGSYYLDKEGDTMPFLDSSPVYLPIATGYIEKEFAKTKLLNFTLFLHKNSFWNAQIEQIHVTPNKEIEICPRVGHFQIILGKIDDYQEKLEKLKLFYEKGLNKMGWDRYSIINLKYKDQVVCTKAKKD